MTKTIEVTGKTIEEALASALARLEMEADDVTYEVIERGKSGFLGIGATPAVIRVTYEVEDEPAPAPDSAQPEPEAAQPKVTAPAAASETGEDERAVRAEAFLRGLLKHMGVEAEITMTERANGGLCASLQGRNMGAVIGRRGETLDAIQHLTNYAVNRGSDKRMHISVDAENYRAKREESLVRLAEKMAAKVLKYKRSMALEPMNSYERHVIHTALQNYEGVSTSSTGVEPNRRVVVTYEKPQVKSTRPESREWS